MFCVPFSLVPGNCKPGLHQRVLGQYRETLSQRQSRQKWLGLSLQSLYIGKFVDSDSLLSSKIYSVSCFSSFICWLTKDQFLHGVLINSGDLLLLLPLCVFNVFQMSSSSLDKSSYYCSEAFDKCQTLVLLEGLKMQILVTSKGAV